MLLCVKELVEDCEFSRLNNVLAVIWITVEKNAARDVPPVKSRCSLLLNEKSHWLKLSAKPTSLRNLHFEHGHI